MTEKVIAVFPHQIDARGAIQEILTHNMARQQDISVVTGTAAHADEDTGQEELARGGSVVSGTSLALLTGLATLAIPGIGLALVGVPIATALGAAAGGEDDGDTRLHEILRRVGLREAEAHGYAVSIRQGRTLITVDIADDQSGPVTAIFRRHGGAQLEFRSLEQDE